MDTPLRITTHRLMKALEDFYPFVKNAEQRVSMLESDVANLTERKRNLEKEISDQIKQADSLIMVDKKRTKEKLDQAEKMLEEAQAIFYELYKAKTTKIVPPPEYGDMLDEKAKVLKGKVKEAVKV